MDEKTLKLKIGRNLLDIAILIGLFSYMAKDNMPISRLLICIASGLLGIGIRSIFYTRIFKNVSEPTLNIPDIYRSYLFYSLTLTIITIFIFISFYNTMMEMPRSIFYLANCSLFTLMGLTVEKVISKFI